VSDYPSYDDGFDCDYDPYYEPEYEPEYEDHEDDGLDSEDEEYSNDDRSSLGLGGFTKQEDDKTTVPTADSAPLPSADGVQAYPKQDVKEEKHDKLEVEGIPSFPRDLTTSDTGREKQASRNPEVGPDVQTEGKRVRIPGNSESADPRFTPLLADLAKPQI
jgi:hypothetical protein